MVSRRPRGAVVSAVERGSPAAAAGFRPGDRVVALDGQAVDGAEEYRFRARELPIGATAQVELVRGRERLTLPLRAVELSLERVEELVTRRTGLTLGEVKTDDGGRYVVVQSVRRGSPAARVGLAAGDLVREVNSREVGSLAELRRQAARARRSGQLVLLVQRGYAAERIAFDLD